MTELQGSNETASDDLIMEQILAGVDQETLVNKQAEEQRSSIHQKRGELLLTLACGDKSLAEVLRCHVDFTDGHIEQNPRILNGIKFYPVSRLGYVGTRDGVIYLAVDYDGGPSPEEFPEGQTMHEVGTDEDGKINENIWWD